MGGVTDVEDLVHLVAGELAAHYDQPLTAELLGAIRALMLEAWERGAIAADPTTVPAGRSPVPLGLGW